MKPDSQTDPQQRPRSEKPVDAFVEDDVYLPAEVWSTGGCSGRAFFVTLQIPRYGNLRVAAMWHGKGALDSPPRAPREQRVSCSFMRAADGFNGILERYVVQNGVLMAVVRWETELPKEVASRFNARREVCLLGNELVLGR